MRICLYTGVLLGAVVVFYSGDKLGLRLPGSAYASAVLFGCAGVEGAMYFQRQRRLQEVPASVDLVNLFEGQTQAISEVLEKHGQTQYDQLENLFSQHFGPASASGSTNRPQIATNEGYQPPVSRAEHDGAAMDAVESNRLDLWDEPEPEEQNQDQVEAFLNDPASNSDVFSSWLG